VGALLSIGVGIGLATYYVGAANEVAFVTVSPGSEVMGERSLATVPAAVVPAAADSFVEGIGVNTHLFYSTYQAQLPAIKTLISQSGIRFIRDGLPGTDNTSTGFKVYTDNLSQLVTPQGNRVKLILTTGYGTNISSSNYPTHSCFIIRVRRIAQAGQITCGDEQMHATVGGTPLLAVEGPNEVDHCGSFETTCQAGGGTWYDKSLRKTPSWPTVMATYMSDLNTVLANDAATSNVSILGPSFVHVGEFSGVATGGGSNLFQDLQVMNSQLEYGNLHAYCDDDPLKYCTDNTAYMDLHFLPSSAFFTGKPMWMTEVGYSRYNSAGADAVTEIEQSKMSLRTVADLFDLGMERSTFYEFYDQGAGAATPREGNFGIVRNDGTPKVAYTSLKNMISLLQEAPGTGITPTPLTYAITSQGSVVKGTLLRKSTGAYYLLLRNDTTTTTDVDASVTATVDFGTEISSLKTYRPMSGTGVQQTFTGQSVSLQVPDDILIAEITLASVGGAPGAAATAVPTAGPTATPASTATTTAKGGATSSPSTTTSDGSTGTVSEGGEATADPLTSVSDETAQKSTTPIGVTVEAAEEFVSALTTKQYAGMVGGGVAGIFLVVLGIIARVRTIKRLAKSGPIVMNF
jgi:hypothetical protein